MRWVAPSEKDTANETLEKRLWAAADQFRANSGLKAGQDSTPVLGLIFLRFAEARFAKRRAELEKAGGSARRGMSRIGEVAALSRSWAIGIDAPQLVCSAAADAVEKPKTCSYYDDLKDG